MRKIARFAAVLSIGMAVVSVSVASAQYPIVSSPAVSMPVSSGTSYYCAKCGKMHAGQAPTANSSATASRQNPSMVQPTSYSAPVPMASSSAMRASGGVSNVLAALNAQRSRQGIGALRYDGSLQAVAERRAQKMASMGLKSHPPGSFSPGTYEGVGWSSSYSPSGVSACFTSDTRMQYAGAAMATGRDGVYFAVVYR
ncbi:MAG: CAP domain-containing protein [Rubripirellula sp.]